MKKQLKTFYKIISIFLVLIFSFNSFSAIVSDNDGANFVTKAEFESLKNSFAQQVDKYNESIDGKIDGAIAAYLAGIATDITSEQTSLMNQFNKYSFVNTFTNLGKTTKIGDKRVCTAYFQVIFSAADSNHNNRYMGTWRCDLTTSSSGQAAAPTKQTYGTDEGCFLIYKDSSWNNRYKVANKYIESTAVATCIVTYSAMYSPYITGTTMTDQSYVVEPDDSQTTWGSSAASVANNYFQINSSSGSATMSGTKSWSQQDKSTTVKNILSSGTVPVGHSQSDILTMHNDDVNKLDKANRLLTTDYCHASMVRLRVSDKSSAAQSPTPDVSGMGIKSYRHKYDNPSDAIAYSEFILDDISQVTNKPVHYYSGLPMFEASDNGIATCTIVFNNSKNKNSSFEIRPYSFDNADITPGISQVSNNDCNFEDFSDVASGIKYTISFRVKKGVIYWIKVKPSTTDGDTSVTSASIVIKSEA